LFCPATISFSATSIIIQLFWLLVLTMTVAAASALTPGRRVAGRHAAIVGGSLGGLAAAHALEKTGWSVDVYERSPTELRNKGSGLGFVHVPSWERLTQRPMMRRQQRASRAQGSFYYGDLWGYLYDGLAQNENVKVHLGKTITELQGTVEAPIINKTPYDLVVLVDGGFSALRHHVLGADIKPEYAGYVVWRGGVPASKLSPELQSNLRYLEGVYKSPGWSVHCGSRNPQLAACLEHPIFLCIVVLEVEHHSRES